MNRGELRRILKNIDKAAAMHIHDPKAQEQVRDAMSDLSEYMLSMCDTLTRQQSMLAKVFVQLSIKP